MIRLIVFFVVVALLAWVGVWFADHPGQVTVSWLGTTRETSVGILLLGVAIVGIAMVVLFEVLRALWRAPRTIGHAVGHRREARGFDHLSQGLVAAASGDVEQAQRHTRRAEGLLSSPATLLLSAQTAQLEGREDVAHRKFLEMLNRPETEFLGLRGLLSQAIRDGDNDEAMDLVRRAHRLRPQAPWVTTSMFELQIRDGLWRDAFETTLEMRKFGQLAPAATDRRKAVLFHMMADAAQKDGRRDLAMRYARSSFKLAPGLVPNAVFLAERALDAGKWRFARKTLETAWARSPHPDLASVHARLRPNESAEARLDRTIRLAAKAPDHVESLVAVANAAIAARKFDEAEKALERALALEPVGRVFRLRAELEQARGASPAFVRQWRDRASQAKPDFAWVCQASGIAQPSWSPLGPMGDFDSLVWTIPSPLQRLLPGDAQGPRIEAIATTSPAMKHPAPDAGQRQAGAPAPATSEAAAGDPGRPEDKPASSQAPIKSPDAADTPAKDTLTASTTPPGKPPGRGEAESTPTPSPKPAPPSATGTAASSPGAVTPPVTPRPDAGDADDRGNSEGRTSAARGNGADESGVSRAIDKLKARKLPPAPSDVDAAGRRQ